MVSEGYRRRWREAEAFAPMDDEEQEALIRRAANYKPLFPRD